MDSDSTKTIEYMKFEDAGRVKFANGTLVPLKHEVKYLVCNLIDRGDPAREVTRRIR